MSDGEKNAADIDIIRIALTANSFRERLADLCHAQWSGWMRYMLGDCSSDVCRAVAGPDGEVPKPKIDHTEYRQRWQRQMSTPYAELSDSEQASDRKEADRFIALIATGLNDAAELIQKRVIGIADKAIVESGTSSHSDAVKEAIAAYEAHRPCEGDKGRAYCPDSFYACMEARKFGPLLAALADAKRKLANAIEANAKAIQSRPHPSPRDAERLERYVHAAFLRRRREKWPDIRMACKALGWTMARIEAALEDSELLDTQEWYCCPPEPRRDHEIYSCKDDLYV